MKLTVSHVLDCDAAAFWRLYLDAAWVQRLHLEALGSTSVEVLAQKGKAPKAVSRQLRYGQRPDTPGPLKKLFGDEVVSVEDGAYDPGTGTWAFTLVPGTLGDKTTINGSMVAVDQGDGTSELTFTLEAKVKLLGVGGIAEKFIERQARDSQEKTAAFVNQEVAG